MPASDDEIEVRPRRVLRRVFALGWRYRWWFLSSLAITGAAGAATGYLLVAIERLFRAWSTIENKEALAPEALNAAREQMNDTALELIALAAPAGLLAYGAFYIGQRLANMCIRDLRLDFVTHLVELDLGFHSAIEKGDLMARMMDDINRLRSMVQRIYSKVLQRPIELVVLIGFVTYINRYLGAFLFLSLIPITLVLWRLVGRIKGRSREARKALATNVVTFEQITSGIRVIKAMGSAERERERFQGSNQTLYDKLMRVAQSRASSEGLTYFAAFALVAGFLWLGNWLFTNELVTPSELVPTLFALGKLTTNLREIQHALGDLVQHAPAAERVFAVLDRQPAIRDEPDAPTCPEPRDGIRLEAVRFRYGPDDDEVLRGIDLEIPVGRTVALVGASGGGKSTLIDLIPRLQDVTDGIVRWDGVDVRDYRASSVVHHCAIVQQDAFLFDDTVYENIRYGRPEATREEVEAAARRANIHDDILRLEGGDGYETRVGDRGSRLSGGQRQRVAIARALLRDAPVLLLDEPTSALDAGSEAHVQAALDELMRGRTTVVIAHRLATVRHADAIYVLGGKDDGELRGRLMESGTHEELIAAGGAYAELVKRQDLGSRPS